MPADILLGLIRTFINVFGLWFVFIFFTWEIVVKDKIKGGPVIKKFGKIFMPTTVVFYAVTSFPNYIVDLVNVDIGQKVGIVDENKISPPAMYFIGQSLLLKGWKLQNESFDLGLSGTLVRPNHTYRIRYLKRSRQIVTIEEVLPGQDIKLE